MQKSPVSIDKFRRLFVGEHNISFKNPKSDTCSKCDCLNIKIEKAKIEKDKDLLKSLSDELELHHRKAKAGQDSIMIATREAQEEEGIYVITFDLQQALPTPKLSTGPAFYKKKLFCYNLSIHCCSEKQGYFYVWDEGTAGRGADEIGSCLLKHFERNNIWGEKLIAFSDNCGGQNKNWTIVAVWLKLIADGRFKTVSYTFPQVGHTMLPSYPDFGVVEKYVWNHCQYVFSPSEWEEVLRKCQKKKPMIVYHMTTDDFVKISNMRENFNQACTACTGEKFGIRNVVKMEFSWQEPDKMKVCNSYHGEMDSVSLRRRGRPVHFLEGFKGPLPILRRGLRPVEAAKLNDVLSCFPYIPEVHHAYYKTLKVADKSNSNDDSSDSEI